VELIPGMDAAVADRADGGTVDGGLTVGGCIEVGVAAGGGFDPLCAGGFAFGFVAGAEAGAAVGA